MNEIINAIKAAKYVYCYVVFNKDSSDYVEVKKGELLKKFSRFEKDCTIDYTVEGGSIYIN